MRGVARGRCLRCCLRGMASAYLADVDVFRGTFSPAISPGLSFFLFFGGSFSFNGFLSFVFEGPRMDAGEIFFQQFPSSSRFVSITRSIDWKRRRRHLSIPLVVCFLWRTRSFSSLVFCSFLKKRRNPNEKKRKSPHFFFMDRTRAKNETSDNRRTLFTNSSPTPSKEGRPSLVARPFFFGGGGFFYIYQTSLGMPSIWCELNQIMSLAVRRVQGRFNRVSFRTRVPVLISLCCRMQRSVEQGKLGVVRKKRKKKTRNRRERRRRRRRPAIGRVVHANTGRRSHRRSARAHHLIPEIEKKWSLVEINRIKSNMQSWLDCLLDTIVY